jgi:predicted DNA-binding ribbon-helix-helix protein
LKTLRRSFYSDNGLAPPRADIGELIRRVVNEISPYVASVSEAVPKISRDTYTAFEELFFYGGDRGQCMAKLITEIDRVRLLPPQGPGRHRVRTLSAAIRIFVLQEVLARADNPIEHATHRPAAAHRSYPTAYRPA